MKKGFALAFLAAASAAFGREVEIKHVGTLIGKNAGDQLGFAIQPMGDFDGDGVNDFLVGGQNAEARVISGSDFTTLKYFSDVKGDFGAVLLPPVRLNPGDPYTFIFGVPTVLIGDPAKHEEDTHGAVAIYRPYKNSDGTVTYSPQWINGKNPEDFLGESLAWLGGPDQLFVVGAARFTGGTAYVYSAVDGRLMNEIESRKTDGHENDRKGYSVWTLPDMDGDRFPDFAVGAAGQSKTDRNFQDAGRIYFYSGKQTGKSGNLKLLNILEGANPTCHLGISLAVLGDLNGDGISEIAVGTPYETMVTGDMDKDGVKETIPITAFLSMDEQSLVQKGIEKIKKGGAAYVLDGKKLRYDPKSGPEVIRVDLGNVLSASFGEGKNQLNGLQFAAFNDVNNDGIADFWVASPGTSAQIGLVDLLSGKNTGDGDSFLASVQGDQPGQWFGTRLAVDPSLSRLYVGSPYYGTSEKMMFQGRVDIYDVIPSR